MKTEDRLNKLKIAFSKYKGEWLRDDIYQHFSEPYYFSDLKDIRPCVLQGGRGTGKTMVLRSLSYEGQFNILKKDIEEFDKNEFIGVYIRVNTNHARAFEGGDISMDVWSRAFGHFINLTFVREIVKFLLWHNNLSSNDKQLTEEECCLVAKSLGIMEMPKNQEELFKNIRYALYEFQAQLNSIFDTNGKGLRLSLYEYPIELITEIVTNLPQFKNKIIMILLDEFENLSDYQQIIMNTMIKHITKNYTFKIGVRELGWRKKHTFNDQEILNTPADYYLLDIQKKFEDAKVFSDFAKKVCEKRIKEAFEDEDTSRWDVNDFLENINNEDEAIKLGIENTDYIKQFASLPSELNNELETLPLLYKYLIAYWADSHNDSLEDEINHYLTSKREWDTRYNNYKYAMLFKIKQGRGMGGIQKYYAGWDTFIKLAGGNIRYLTELVYNSYEQHILKERGVDEKISIREQTKAARDTGLKNLEELEGLSKLGAQLVKLLFNMGQIFKVYARLDKKSPEVNQFELIGERTPGCQELINTAVMNLALIREPGTKPNDEYTTKDYIFSIHPIFSPFFIFSYRKKRKMKISVQELMALASNDGHEVMKRLMYERDGISIDDKKTMQLDLFADYGYD